MKNKIKEITQEIFLQRPGLSKLPKQAIVKGCFAMHTKIDGNQWVVTHVASGKCVEHFGYNATVTESKIKAKKLLNLLCDLKLPEENLTKADMRQIAYRVYMLRHDLTLENAIEEVDKQLGVLVAA